MKGWRRETYSSVNVTDKAANSIDGINRRLIDLKVRISLSFPKFKNNNEMYIYDK